MTNLPLDYLIFSLTHIHTHIYIYIYIYINRGRKDFFCFVFVFKLASSMLRKFIRLTWMIFFFLKIIFFNVVVDCEKVSFGY